MVFLAVLSWSSCTRRWHTCFICPCCLKHLSSNLCLAQLAHLPLTVLDDGQFDAIALGQRDPRLVALADHEDVVQARGPGVAHRILAVHNFKGTWMLLAMLDDAHATDVIPAADHGHVARLKLHVVENLVCSDINS